jgi:hypothetical protein
MSRCTPPQLDRRERRHGPKVRHERGRADQSREATTLRGPHHSHEGAVTRTVAECRATYSR